MTDSVQVLTAASFDKAIETSPVWLVDFWADWCGPCHTMKPALAEVAADADVLVGTVDVHTEPALSERFAVQTLPTIIVFRNGEAVRRLYGAKTARQLRAAVIAVHVGAGDTVPDNRLGQSPM